MDLGYSATSYPPVVGGAQIHAHMLARTLAGMADVRVASLWSAHRTDWLLGTTVNAPGSTERYVIDGIRVTRMGLSRGERLGLAVPTLAYPASQAWATERIAASLLPQLRRALPRTDLVHNFRIGREPLTQASLQLARERDVPFVLTPFHHPRWGGWLHRVYHQLYRQADAVLALTESEREVLIDLGVKADRIAVVGHGPVLAPTPNGARFLEQLGGSEPYVLFLGQKYPYKGIDALLGAAPRVWADRPETRFVFIGPRTKHSRDLFREGRDSRIIEMDELSLEVKTDALAGCSLLCVPSTQESFGGVYAEAWALGKPVIAADIPATRELIEPEVDGLLVSQTPEQIAEAILQILADPAGAAAMGARGRAKVEKHFQWPGIADLVRAAYDRAIHGSVATSV